MATQQPKGEHLRGKTTVVAGAGVIGLSIARELASSAVKAGINHNIVVVEMNDKVASQASNECAGLISGHAVPRSCKQLLRLSTDAWKDLVSNESMRNMLHYQPDSLVHTQLRYQPGGLVDTRLLAEHANDRLGETPAWFNSREGETVRVDAADVGKISTHRYVEWLKKECDQLGVTFHFSWRVGFLETLKDGTPKSIVLESVVPGEERQMTVPCHNLIIAGGPWTSGTVKDVLPDCEHDFENYCQFYGWTHVKPENFEERDNVGIQIRSARDEDSGLIAGNDRYGDITVATLLSARKNGDLFPSTSNHKSTNHGMGKLTALATSRVKNFDESKVTHKGASIISTAAQYRPLIAKLPEEMVNVYREKCNKSPLGVYMVYGFGKFGTTLAPGAGIAVRRMVFGEDSGVAEDSEGYSFDPVREA